MLDSQIALDQTTTTTTTNDGPTFISYEQEQQEQQERAMEAAIIKQAIMKTVKTSNRGLRLNDDVLGVINSFAFYPQDQYKQKQYKDRLIKKMKKCSEKSSEYREGFYEGHWGWQLASTQDWENEDTVVYYEGIVYEELVQFQNINCMTCGNFISMNRMNFRPYEHENKHMHCDCEYTYELLNAMYWRQ